MAVDIKVDTSDDDFDLRIVDGDLDFGQSEQQHMEHILLADRGQWRQWPLVGVGIRDNLNGPFDPVALESKINTQLESDIFRVNLIEISRNGTVSIDANEK